MVEGKAAQSEFVGKLVHATGQLDKVTDKLRFLEQERRPKIGGPSRSLSTSRVSRQGKSPTFSADSEVAGIFAQPPEWPSPPVAKTSVEWSKLTGSPFQFGQPATGALSVATDTVPFRQLVPETLPDQRSTGGKEEEESESFCHFSEYESNGEGPPAESEEDGTGSEEEPEGVLEVTPQLDSGGTTHQAPVSSSPKHTSVRQEPPEEAQEENKVAVRGHPGQGSCGEAECDRPDG